MRVKILTAGVSLADTLMREGINADHCLDEHLSRGWDIVGTVDKIGEKLSTTPSWQIGDIIAALTIVGGYAQYLCVPSSRLVSVPSVSGLRRSSWPGPKLQLCISNAPIVRPHKIG